MRDARPVGWRGIRHFARHNAGSIALTFALSSIPTLGIIGAALDYSRATDTKAKMQSAADSAALAAAEAARDKSPNVVGQAHATYEQHIKALKLTGRSERLVIDKGIYRYEASAKVAGTLSAMIAPDGLPVEVKASATYGNSVSQPTELTFVVDVTNSMKFGSAWDNMIQAVKDTLEEIKGTQGSSEFFVTLVPMSDRVRLPSFEPSWSDVNPQPADWRGCFEPREIPEPGYDHALTDDPPIGKNKFKPSVKAHLIPYHRGWNWTPNTGMPDCPHNSIVGPTSDIPLIESGLKTLQNIGTGRPDEGMAWGWRTISENWRGHWGVGNYPAKKGDRRKVAILMTDGHNTIYDSEVSGYKVPPTYGWNNGSELGFKHMVRVCEKMKAQGIEIYSFWTGGNSKYEPFAKQCASDETHYFAHVYDAPSFSAAFKKVTGGTSSKQSSYLRLIR